MCEINSRFISIEVSAPSTKSAQFNFFYFQDKKPNMSSGKKSEGASGFDGKEEEERHNIASSSRTSEDNLLSADEGLPSLKKTPEENILKILQKDKSNEKSNKSNVSKKSDASKKSDKSKKGSN